MYLTIADYILAQSLGLLVQLQLHNRYNELFVWNLFLAFTSDTGILEPQVKMRNENSMYIII